MKKNNLFIFAFTILAICSCNSKEQQTNNELNCKTLSVDVTNKSGIPTGIITDISYIPLETSEECLIGKIDKLLVDGDRIYVLDATNVHGLFVFDTTGKFIFKIHKRGKGPGEYKYLNDFTLHNNSIVLVSFDKAIFYDLDGNYQRTIKSEISFKNILFTKNNNAYLYQNCNSCNEGIISKHIAYANEKLEVKNEFVDPMRKEIHSFHRLQKLNESDTVLMSAPKYMTNVIYQFADKKSTPYLKFDFGEYNVPENIYRDPEVKVIDNNLHEYGKLKYIIDTKEILFFSISQGRYLYVGLHFKSKDKTYIGHNIIIPSSPMVNQIKGNKLYTTISCSKLQQAPPPEDIDSKDFVNDMDKYNYLVEISKFAKTVDPNDNPVVVRYTLNFDN